MIERAWDPPPWRKAGRSVGFRIATLSLLTAEQFSLRKEKSFCTLSTLQRRVESMLSTPYRSVVCFPFGGALLHSNVRSHSPVGGDSMLHCKRRVPTHHEDLRVEETRNKRRLTLHGSNSSLPSLLSPDEERARRGLPGWVGEGKSCHYGRGLLRSRPNLATIPASTLPLLGECMVHRCDAAANTRIYHIPLCASSGWPVGCRCRQARPI